MGALQPRDPEQVGSYRLLNRLGTGGMGRVYLGQAPDGRMVAVKLIRSELADNIDFRRRFAQEVAAARRVSGVFTAHVVDAEPDGSQPWLVTAYVAGPSLADAVADYGPLPVDSVLVLAAGLAAGLGAVHAAGIVHRDLKPSNVLLASDGPRIIDFGISGAMDTTWPGFAGRVMGSPGFMSPEQAAGGEVGPPTDIFSLGGVLAFAVTGRPPFGTGSSSTLAHRVVYGTAALGHVPVELRPLIERCLAKDPAARPTTSHLLAEFGPAEPAKDWLARHAPFRRASATTSACASLAAPPLASAAAASAAVAPRTSAGAEPRAIEAASRATTSGAEAAHPVPSLARAAVNLRDTASNLRGTVLSLRGAAVADRTRPARIVRRSRHTRQWAGKAGLLGWAIFVAVLSAAASAGALLATHQHAPARHLSANQLPLPRTDQRKHVEAGPGPRAVVRAYFAAIDARDWQKVWQLGGDRLNPSYDAMVAGYANTVRDEIRSIQVTGNQIVVRVRAVDSSGGARLYRVEYTVQGGVITAGHVLAQ